MVRLGTGTILAFIIMGLAMLVGCLLPPPVEEIPEPENQPPRIVWENVQPEPYEPVLMTTDTECLAQQFTASVIDPDVEDHIYWRVFLDPHINAVRVHEGVEKQRQEGNPQPVQFEVTPDDATLYFRGRSAEPHIVMFFISDREMDSVGGRGALDPEEEEERLQDGFSWTVELGEECPSPQASSGR